MSYHSNILRRPQNINIFSKKRADRVRMRWPYLLIVLFAVFVGIFAVWERVQYVRTAYGIQLLKQDHEKLIQEKRKLLLEYNTSISLDRVEKRARKQLKMKVPEKEAIIYAVPGTKTNEQGRK